METFTFLNRRWSVDKARDIIESKRKRAMIFEVQCASTILPFIHVDEEHATSDQIDLDKPCIMIECKMPRGELGHMFIDGWHRIWRANKDGVEHLKTFCLTVEEAKECEL